MTAAVREGIVSGDGTQTGTALRAGEGITLAEAAVILDNAVSMESNDVTGVTAAEVPAWAESALSKLCANGILAADAASTVQTVKELTQRGSGTNAL